MIELGLWFMLPVGVVIATIAMMGGIGGAVLFAPFFILVLKLDPLLALAAGLLIEVFGFSSGVIGYLRQKSVNFHLVRHIIPFTLVATVLGVVIGRYVSVVLLKLMLAVLILYLSYAFFSSAKECRPRHPAFTGPHQNHVKHDLPDSVVATSAVGGLLVGMISAGLGEINEYNFFRRLRMKVSVASGTSVFLVAMSAILGVLSHFFFLLQEESLAVFGEVLSLLIFTVPGVIIGAQIGVRLSKHTNPVLMGRFIGVLFFVLGALTVLTVI